MNKLKFRGINIYYNTIIPFGHYRFITLFGTVWTKMNYEDLTDYLNTIMGKRSVNHEVIHMLQSKSLEFGWIQFYILYIWYFLKCYLCTFKWRLSYKTIPFEAEAYANMDDFNYTKSYWKDYIMSNEERKTYYDRLFKY